MFDPRVLNHTRSKTAQLKPAWVYRGSEDRAEGQDAEDGLHLLVDQLLLVRARDLVLVAADPLDEVGAGVDGVLVATRHQVRPGAVVVDRDARGDRLREGATRVLEIDGVQHLRRAGVVWVCTFS